MTEKSRLDKIRDRIETHEENAIAHPEVRSSPAFYDIRYLLAEVDQLRARLKGAESYLKNIASPGRGYVEPRLPMEVELARAYFAKHGGGK